MLIRYTNPFPGVTMASCNVQSSAFGYPEKECYFHNYPVPFTSARSLWATVIEVHVIVVCSQTRVHRFITMPFTIPYWERLRAFSVTPIPAAIKPTFQKTPVCPNSAPEARRLTRHARRFSDRKFSNYLSKRRWRVPRGIMACKINRIGRSSRSWRSAWSGQWNFFHDRERRRGEGRGGARLSAVPERSTWRVNQSRGKQADDQLAW